MSYNLATEKKIAMVSMLCENSSIRAIKRMSGVHRDTVMRPGVRMGEGCASILKTLMVDLNGTRTRPVEASSLICCGTSLFMTAPIGDRAG